MFDFWSIVDKAMKLKSGYRPEEHIRGRRQIAANDFPKGDF